MTATVQSITAELVQAGYPRIDMDNTADIEAEHPGVKGVWDIVTPDPRTDRPTPQAVVMAELVDIGVIVSAISCHCCQNIVRVEFFDNDGDRFAALPFWGSLSSTRSLANTLSAHWFDSFADKTEEVK
jgi:hypothetical protein